MTGRPVAPLAKDLVAPHLEILEKNLADFADRRTGFLKEITTYVMVGKGKRLRPALVYMTSGLGQADPQEVHTVAMVVELIHMATLVHDDLVDQASLRHQKPTVAVRYGGGTSVLLGDFIYAEAFRRLSSLKRPSLVQLYAETTSLMCEGEIAQLEGRHRFDTCQKEYLDFISKKTASLMAVSAAAGGELSGLNRDHVLCIKNYGHALGMAFQIRDDLMDVMGQENEAGKTLRTDLLHGKMTLPLIHLRDHLDGRRRLELEAFVKNPDGQIDQVISWMAEENSLKFSSDLAQQYGKKAIENIKKLPSSQYQVALVEFVEAMFFQTANSKL